jgi:hypothetical protein
LSLILGTVRTKERFITMVSDSASWKIRDGKPTDPRIADRPKATILETTPRLLFGWAGAYYSDYRGVAEQFALEASAFESVEAAAHALWETLLRVHMRDFGLSATPGDSPDVAMQCGLDALIGGFDGDDPSVFEFSVTRGNKKRLPPHASDLAAMFAIGNCTHINAMDDEIKATLASLQPEDCIERMARMMLTSERLGALPGNMPSCMGPYHALCLTPSHKTRKLGEPMHAFLYTPFPSVVLQKNQQLTKFATTGTSSTATYSLPNATSFEVYVEIALGVVSNDGMVIVGDTHNGYGLRWNASNGNVTVVKYVGGTGPTTIATIDSGLTVDTLPHAYRFAVTPQVGTNMIEGSFDQSKMIGGPVFDGALTLQSGTWPITIMAGGPTGTVLQFNVEHARSLYLTLPYQVSAAIGSDGSLQNGVYLGTSGSAGFMTGAAVPSGSPAGGKGTIYVRTAGGVGSTLYCWTGAAWTAFA